MISKRKTWSNGTKSLLPLDVNALLNLSNKNTCIIKKSKSKYENTTAGHVNPEKPILEKKNGDRVPPINATVLPLGF